MLENEIKTSELSLFARRTSFSFNIDLEGVRGTNFDQTKKFGIEFILDEVTPQIDYYYNMIEQYPNY